MAGVFSAKSVPLTEPMNGAAAEYADGTLVMSLCTKPPMSPRPEISWTDPGGAARSSTAVSSRPCALTPMATLPPVSHAVRLEPP